MLILEIYDVGDKSDQIFSFTRVTNTFSLSSVPKLILPSESPASMLETKYDHNNDSVANITVVDFCLLFPIQIL